MAQPQGGFAEMQKSRVCTRRRRGVVGARFQGGRGLYPPASAGTQVAGYLKDTTHSCFEAWIGVSMDNL